MNKFKSFAIKVVPFLFFVGCAGTQKSCQSCNNEEFGANWIIVQYKFDGTPINCWRLNGGSVSNEPSSDGIWFESGEKNLIHISGWYNRVQVNGSDFDAASKEIGVDLSKCPGGKYRD